MDRDALNNASVKQTAEMAFRLVDVAQHYPQAVQAAGVALAFVMICDRYGVPPNDVWTVVTNMIRAARTSDDNELYRALYLYVQHELGARA